MPEALIYEVKDGRARLVGVFSNLTMEQGGIGAGTIITFDMRVLGRTNRVRGVVTEPEPGRVLVETYPESGVVTTFRVEPAGAGESVVTISSSIPARHALTPSARTLDRHPRAHPGLRGRTLAHEACMREE